MIVEKKVIKLQVSIIYVENFALKMKIVVILE